MELTIRLRAEGDGYWADVVELPGCFASGQTLDELREALEEAVSLYLADGADEAPEPVRRTLRIDELRALV
ncbi:MAG TPA: type II toxin-antitoxin system HicB family antitoxin [Solirubrobacteraceae bacterium]